MMQLRSFHQARAGRVALPQLLLSRVTRSSRMMYYPSRIGTIRFLARPGYPAMRMWPDQAGHFFGEYENLEIVHPEFSKRRIPVGPEGFGTFCIEEKPLKVIYMPQRLGPDSDITIEPLSKKNAFFALIQNSFTAGLVEALGLQPQRMNFFTRMVMQVPMRRFELSGRISSSFPRGGCGIRGQQVVIRMIDSQMMYPDFKFSL